MKTNRDRLDFLPLETPKRSVVSSALESVRRATTGLAGFCFAAAMTQPVQATMGLPGSFEVSETGAAAYTIPIAVPPGTSGMTPSLSLTYNSRGGNGLLGVGWSLAGLPAITRCLQTIAQDGVVGGIAHGASDRFCLEGERLVVIGTGAYGADGTEYRTEREGFSKIVSYGAVPGPGTGPQYFKAWTKSGQVMEFGNTDESRIEAQGKTTARLWTVNKVSDTKGNFFTVSYTEDGVTNGEYRPNRIDYTGNAAGLTPYASVRFVYEQRPAADITPLYEAGSLIKTTQRLTNVRTYVGESLVSDYRLTYASGPLTSRSRLTEMRLCDSGGTCLPATVFSWQDVAAGFSPQALWSSYYGGSAGWNGTTFPRMIGDVNGDGKADIVALGSPNVLVSLSTGTSFNGQNAWISDFTVGQGWTNNDTYPRFLIDADGDGKEDLFGFAYAGASVGKSNGTSFVGGPVWISYFGVGSSWANQTSYPRHVADVNGDGLPDIIGFANDGTYVALSNGASFGTHSQWTAQFGSVSEGYGNDSVWPRILADVNGDGKVDIVGFASSGVYVALSTGTGFLPTQLWYAGFTSGTGWSDMDAYPRMLVDVNGDGKADIVGFASDGVYVSLSTGVSFASATRWSTEFGLSGGWSNNNAYPRFIADVNGDGRADVVGFASGGVVVGLNRGTDFAQSQTWSTDFGLSGGWSDQTSYPRQLADVNGDGKPDIVGFASVGTYVGASLPDIPDILISVASPLGATTQITYRPLTEGGSLYAKGSTAVFPTVDLQAPIYVVSQVMASDGIGTNYSSTYSYAGAKAHVRGRGFLGFDRMTVKDAQTNVEQVSTFHQDYPLTGLVKTRVKKLGADELNRTEHDYGTAFLDPPNNKRSFVFLTQSVEKSWELPAGGSQVALPIVTTTYEYFSSDPEFGYGNVKKVTVGTGDGYSKVTENTYDNYPSSWILGRLSRATVTSVTP